jgi:glycosyltransferase involved in cell wall biosynthesis
MELQLEKRDKEKVEKSSESLISIIVITYNSDNYVIETLESAKSQTYLNIELIISDDGSTDNTVENCEKWVEENKHRFVRSKIVTNAANTGICANLNRGLYQALGEWIKVIAGDDILTKECISKCMDFIKNKAAEDIQIVHGSAKMYYKEFKENNFFKKRGLPEWKFNRIDITPTEQYKILLRTCPIVTPTVFIKRNIFNIVGYFDEEFPLWEDRPMWLRLTRAGFRFYFLNEELASYRVHPASVQKRQNNYYFSKYLITKDLAYLKIVIPNLPVYERFLNRYMIFVRRKMIQFGLIKNNKWTHYVYSCLTYFAENQLRKFNSRFDDTLYD